ncbi:MAG TPA: MerR family transcriptional regulator, partial [Frankiaceae bacterium]|nr:MerR family transcriptional regulator [Frankiaceae bacterium]
MAPDPGLTVAAVARRLGVAPATLRSWERRYGMGPSGRTAGAHRRYTGRDLAVLEHMRRLTLDGVAPSDAARVALAEQPAPGAAAAGVPAAEAAVAVELALRTPARLAARARGLSRAALALDAAAVRDLLRESVAEDGVIATWETLLAPVLRAVGERWQSSGEGVEVEHLLSEVAAGVFCRLDADPPAPCRPVLLACADGERHSLPLHALCAALAERRVAARMLGA